MTRVHQQTKAHLDCRGARELIGSAARPWARYLSSPTFHVGQAARKTPPSRGEVTGQFPSRVGQADTECGPTLVRYPRLVPLDAACAKELKKRTLTNLYNQRPAWLDLAHQRLDEAVFAAYGWPPSLTDDELLSRLLALNLARAASERGASKP